MGEKKNYFLLNNTQITELMSESHHKVDEYLHVTCEIARVYDFSVPEAIAEKFQSIYRACY
jgi:hypothetical protein